MVQFIKYIKISLNNTISNMMVEFFSFTLRLTRHSQVNKFVVKAFFAKGKKKKMRKLFMIPLMKTELKWEH